MNGRRAAPQGSRFEKALNLVSLARTGAGTAQAVPGTALEVSFIDTRKKEHLDHSRWLLLLEGELIIDLPYGDFRILAAGDSLRLPAGLEIACQPVQPSVVLWGPAD